MQKEQERSSRESVAVVVLAVLSILKVSVGDGAGMRTDDG